MKETVLLFDGVCNLCNGMVQFILKHERGNQIKFGPLQSEAGKKFMDQQQLDSSVLNSILFIEDSVVYQKSEAVFRIVRYLRSPWSWIRFVNFLPRSLNNFIYDFIAKYRYRIFGKTESCMIPGKEWESRFLK